jgi:hypothetical protein
MAIDWFVCESGFRFSHGRYSVTEIEIRANFEERVVAEEQSQHAVQGLRQAATGN